MTRILLPALCLASTLWLYAHGSDPWLILVSAGLDLVVVAGAVRGGGR